MRYVLPHDKNDSDNTLKMIQIKRYLTTKTIQIEPHSIHLFGLGVHDCGVGLRLIEGPGVKLQSVGWCLILVYD